MGNQGGTDGNERLTVLTGVVLIALLAVLGVTIVLIGQLLWLHLFLGLVLLGPIALKLASTGYRFVRYYTRDPAYRRKGPPPAVLRGLAPLVVLSTVTVFATGVALLFVGPPGNGLLREAHKVSFIAWIAVTAIHVLGHLPEIVGVLASARRSRREMIALGSAPAAGGREGWAHLRSVDPVAGARARAGALLAASVSGLVLAIALLGQFPPWTH